MQVPTVTASNLLAIIQVVRGVEVLLDEDVAVLYGIELRDVIECIAQNPDCFPDDFVFRLEEHEIAALPQPLALNGDTPRRLVFALTEHAVAFLLRWYNADERGVTLVEILRGFTLYRRLLAPTY